METHVTTLTTILHGVMNLTISAMTKRLSLILSLQFISSSRFESETVYTPSVLTIPSQKKRD